MALIRATAEATRTVLAEYEAHYNGRRPIAARHLRPARPDHPDRRPCRGLAEKRGSSCAALSVMVEKAGHLLTSGEVRMKRVQRASFVAAGAALLLGIPALASAAAGQTASKAASQFRQTGRVRQEIMGGA